jgi:predicted MFS family arabinose efflux permease
MSVPTRVVLAIAGGILLGLSLAIASKDTPLGTNEGGLGLVGAGLAIGLLFASRVPPDRESTAAQQ